MPRDLATDLEREERRYAREVDQREGVWDGEHPLTCNCRRCQHDQYEPGDGS